MDANIFDQLVREEKADLATEDAIADTGTSPQARERRTSFHRKKSLHLPASPSRSRSRSRRATITDQGQTGASTSVEQLSHLAPPDPGLAEATRIAPERATSGLAVPKSETPDNSRPVSPPETFIPATDTLSTRPTRGGIAYPFRLKVDGGDRDVNASTVTLQSMGSRMESNEAAEQQTGNVPDDKGEKGIISDDVDGRPHAERFLTADLGAVVGAGGQEEKKDERSANEEKEQGRPVVERFETAMEHPK